MNNEKFIYAGFWKRFVAYLIDQLILSIPIIIILLPLIFIFGVGFMPWEYLHRNGDFNFTQYLISDNLNAANILAMIMFIFVMSIVSIIIKWLYFALMESSSKQATLGKIIMGIIVTDLKGNKITFGKASGRFFGKILSGLILDIGYIMAAFTEKKQALHDIIAGCLVLNKVEYQIYSAQQKNEDPSKII